MTWSRKCDICGRSLSLEDTPHQRPGQPEMCANCRKTNPTPAEREGAKQKFQQWADDEHDVGTKVDEIFNDRRGDR